MASTRNIEKKKCTCRHIQKEMHMPSYPKRKAHAVISKNKCSDLAFIVF